MNKREKLFVLAYTDTTCPKTYQNATQSALKAGYSERNAASHGCKLLKKPILAQEITNIEEGSRKKYQATKDQAILEAREGFLKAKAAQDKTMMKYWNDLWVNLQGWLVQKSEIKSESTIIEAQKDDIYEAVHRYNRDIAGEN